MSNRSSPPPNAKDPRDRPSNNRPPHKICPRDGYMSDRSSPPPNPKDPRDRPNNDRPSPPPYPKDPKDRPSNDKPPLPHFRCDSTDETTQSHEPSGHLDVDTAAAKKIMELETEIRALNKKVKNRQYLEIQLTPIELVLFLRVTILTQCVSAEFPNIDDF